LSPEGSLSCLQDRHYGPLSRFTCIQSPATKQFYKDRFNVILHLLPSLRKWPFLLPFALSNYVPYIRESNPHPNLIRTGFCRFLKRKKKLVRGSNPQLSFNRPLFTRQTDWIILDVIDALTVIRLTRRVWRGHLRNCQRYKRTTADKRYGHLNASYIHVEAIPESIIVRSFTKCCISNALGGSEDDILWEDDGENKDDSDWMTDNDSVMSKVRSRAVKHN
jgi:hypothetical protein